MAMLEVSNLKVNYGMIQAIKGISFKVEEGEIIALIGANGAGKTTTLHTVSDLLKAREGSILFNGKELTKTQPHKIVEMGMAHVPEGRRVFAQLSVYQDIIQYQVYQHRRNPGLHGKHGIELYQIGRAHV